MLRKLLDLSLEKTHMKRLLFLLLLLVATIITVSVRPVSAIVNPGGKVDICHVPPGNPENAHLISIGQAAVRAHLAHGDFFPEKGDCSRQPTD